MLRTLRTFFPPCFAEKSPPKIDAEQVVRTQLLSFIPPGYPAGIGVKSPLLLGRTGTRPPKEGCPTHHVVIINEMHLRRMGREKSGGEEKIFQVFS